MNVDHGTNPVLTTLIDRHDDFKDSAYIFVGGIPYELTEGDIICVFSQYGEILDLNMVRDRETGKPKGFAFIKYDDQRSTVLAVDNSNGATLLGRTLRVDHSRDYRQAKRKRRRSDESESEESEVELDDEGKPRVKGFNVAPKGWLDPPVEEASESEEENIEQGIDLDDPMRDYLIEKRREEKEKKSRKKIKEDGEGKHKHRHRSRKDKEERHHHRHKSDRRRIEGNRDEGKRDGSRHRRRDDTPERRPTGDVTPKESSRRDDTPQKSSRGDDTPEYRKEERPDSGKRERRYSDRTP
jgi:RNA-binding motif protein, X-linked 2